MKLMPLPPLFLTTKNLGEDACLNFRYPNLLGKKHVAIVISSRRREILRLYVDEMQDLSLTLEVTICTIPELRQSPK